MSEKVYKNPTDFIFEDIVNVIPDKIRKLLIENNIKYEIETSDDEEPFNKIEFLKLECVTNAKQDKNFLKFFKLIEENEMLACNSYSAYIAGQQSEVWNDTDDLNVLFKVLKKNNEKYEFIILI